MAECSLAFDGSRRRYGQAMGTIDMVGSLRHMKFYYFRTEHILDMRNIVWGATHEFMSPALPGLNEVEQFSRINVGHLVADQIGEETVRLR